MNALGISRLLATAAALAMAGCGHVQKPEPALDIRESHLPVAQRCPAERPAVPAFGDSDAELLAAADGPERAQRVHGARDSHYAYEKTLNDALTVCGVKP